MKNYKIEIKWGIIFTLMTLIWMVLENLTGLHGEHIDKHATYTNLIAIPAIAIYVFALLDKRKNFYNGIMSYKQGFITGLIISVIVSILSPFTQFLTSTVITPEYFPNIIQYAVEKGEMTKAEAEKYFNLQNYVIEGMFGALFMGIITSAIVALFTRTKTIG